MKDIIITGKRIKKELFILSLCFATAFIMNIYAIIFYSDTSWKELFTQLHVVAALAIVFYVITGAVRIIIYAFVRLIKK